MEHTTGSFLHALIGEGWALELPKVKIWSNSMVLWRYVTIKTEFGEEEYTIGMFSHMGVLQRTKRATGRRASKDADMYSCPYKTAHQFSQELIRI